MSHTPGPWRVGKSGGAVVADTPVRLIGGSDDVQHYGGHLIAESIALQNCDLIAAGPEMFDALQQARAAIGLLALHVAVGRPPNDELTDLAERAGIAVTRAIEKAVGPIW